jgi:hypothetical protein
MRKRTPMKLYFEDRVSAVAFLKLREKTITEQIAVASLKEELASEALQRARKKPTWKTLWISSLKKQNILWAAEDAHWKTLIDLKNLKEQELQCLKDIVGIVETPHFSLVCIETS